MTQEEFEERKAERRKIKKMNKANLNFLKVFKNICSLSLAFIFLNVIIVTRY